MTLIHNERIKLLATYINGLGIALFAVGVLAPVFFCPLWKLWPNAIPEPHEYDLRYHLRWHTLWGKHNPQEDATMTMLQMASFFIAPVGALLICAWALYFAKHME